MEIVTGAMGTLLPKLANLIKQEYKLQSKVRGEIMFLKAELETMQAALLQVSEAPFDQPPDTQAKLWAREVRELSYDLEDSIDRFIVCMELSKRAKPHSFRAFVDKSLSLLTTAKIRRIIGKDVIEIKSRIVEVSERRGRYKVDRAPAKPASRTVDILRLSALYKSATELIGVQKKSDGLVKMLMEGDEATEKKLKVVSIVGFGGLGKTTLANFVYQKLKDHFDCGAFVSISLNPNMTSIFKNLLRQLDKYSDKSEICDEAHLIETIREFLQCKRYFVVIDDVWDSYVWEAIRYALIENGCGSRIITTTRIHDVAKKSGLVYQLGHLSLTDSRKLFYQRIFATQDKCPSKELAELSENILKKCGGVPLAIITIASMLANKNTTENTHKCWSKVYRSMGSGLDDSTDIKNMRTILSTSYYALPPHLRACLLYISLYPEDHEIFVEPLILKWVGEGFVFNEHGDDVYEVGQNYVNDLINRSLIEIVKCSGDEVSSFRVHDMVLDLITFLSNEENFLTTLCGQQPYAVPNKVRRLSLQANKELNRSETLSLSHIRSLTVLASGFIPSFLSFSVLRSLDLAWCQDVKNHHFKDICNLVHLRYLNLSSSKITKVPNKIGNLKLLQVLDIHRTLIVEMPSNFIRLLHLVYLGADSLKRIPNGFGNLKSMEDLDCIIFVKSPTMPQSLSGLSKLRRMRLRFNEWNENYEKNFLRCLSSLITLRHLDIRIKSTVSAVPRCMSSLSSLSILDLKLSTLEEEDLLLLGSLPSLSCLTIWVEKSSQGREEKLKISNNVHPFQSLRKLKICKTIEVVFSQGAMAKLQTLLLDFEMQETMHLPCYSDMGLENLSSLVEVMVDFVHYSANPKVAKATCAAIQDGLDRNPKKPKGIFGKTVVLKMDLFNYEQLKKTRKILDEIDGVYETSLDLREGKVTVYGSGSGLDIITLVAKLRRLISGSTQILSIQPTRTSWITTTASH